MKKSGWLALAGIVAGAILFAQISGLNEESFVQPAAPPQQEQQDPAPAKTVATSIESLVRQKGWPVEGGYTVQESGSGTYALRLVGLECHAVLRPVNDGYKIVELMANYSTDSLTVDDLPSSIKKGLSTTNPSFAQYKQLRNKIMEIPLCF